MSKNDQGDQFSTSPSNKLSNNSSDDKQQDKNAQNQILYEDFIPNAFVFNQIYNQLYEKENSHTNSQGEQEDNIFNQDQQKINDNQQLDDVKDLLQQQIKKQEIKKSEAEKMKVQDNIDQEQKYQYKSECIYNKAKTQDYNSQQEKAQCNSFNLDENDRNNDQQQQQDQQENEDNKDSFKLKNLDNNQVKIVSNQDSEIINQQFCIIQQKDTHNWRQYWKEIEKVKNKIYDYCQLGSLDKLKKLIDESEKQTSIDINSKGLDDWTALHYATNEGHLEVVKYLLSIKADPNCKTSYKRTPLQLAAIRSYDEITKELINYKCTIDEQDKDSNTALHYAAQYGCSNIIKQLLFQHANTQLKNYQGYTAMELSLDSSIKQIFDDFGIFDHSLNTDTYTRVQLNNAILKNSRADHVSKLLYLTNKASINQRSFARSSNDINDNQQKYTEDKQTEQPRKLLSQEEKVQKRFKQLLKIQKIQIYDSQDNQSPIKQQIQQEQQIIQPDKKEELKSKENQTLDLNNQKVGPQDFIIHDQIGRGAFGQVYLVTKKGESEVYYAMKTLSKEKVFTKNLVKYAKTERNILSFMNHPFIVKLKYAFQTENKLYLILEYCPGGDLEKILQRKQKLREELVKKYVCEIILALEALHSSNIIFRDLKPSNVVIDQEGHACLTDFGLSKQGFDNNIQSKSFCGSLAYLSPEMLDKKGHTYSLDWYLLGVLIYECLTGYPPYYTDNKQKLFDNIRFAQLKFPKEISDSAKNLLIKLLERDPKKRLGSKNGADDIKSHSWFYGIDWNDVYQRKLSLPKPPKKKSGVFDDILDEQLKVTFSENKQTIDQDKYFIDGWSFINTNADNQNPQDIIKK